MPRYLLLVGSLLLGLPLSLAAQQQPLPAAMPAAVPSSPMLTYALRLKPGDDLRQRLAAFVAEQHIGAGAVLTCVGSLTQTTLRLANQEGSTVYRGHFEIVSLVGTLAASGSHLHLSVADSTGRTIGGHLLDGNLVYTTAELVIGVLPGLEFRREEDPTFGYRELTVYPAETGQPGRRKPREKSKN